MTAEQRQSSDTRARWWRPYRTLAALVLLAAAVLGYYALRERTPSVLDGPVAVPLVAADSLPEGRGRVLDELAIELAGSTGRTDFSLQRRRTGQAPGFYLMPLQYRADDVLAESLLSALLAARADRRLKDAANTAQGRRAYGVDEDQCRVRVRFAAGHTLCFGAEAPTGSVYVRQDRSSEVLVVDGALYSLLARPPERYRARRLATLPLSTAQQLELGPLRLSRKGELWRVQTPAGGWALAEPAQVDALLRRLLDWQVSSWPAAPPTPGPPRLRLVIDGVELLRGGWPCGSDNPQARLFVRGDHEWLCADEPAAHQLLPPWSELRAQRLVPLANSEIARLQLPADLDVSAEPDGTYRLRGQPIETASAQRLVERLTQARSGAEATTPPPATAARIAVTTAAGQVVTLRLWRAGAQLLMQRDDEAPMAVDEPVAELLAVSELTLLPRKLWELAPAAVTAMDRRGPEDQHAHEVLVRSGGWHLREPTAAPADSAAVAGLLQHLAELRAEQWVARAPRPEHGLQAPRLRLALSIENQPDAALGLLLGAPASERGDCYAQRLGGGPVAVLAAPSCALLLRPVVSPLLLRLDETRLTSVQIEESGQNGQTLPLSCARAPTRWQCGGRALASEAQSALLAALRGLTRGESPSYVAPMLPLRLTVRLIHAPLKSAAGDPLAADSAVLGEEVAPREQTLRLYAGAAAGPGAKDGRGWLARLAERDVTYQVPAAAAQALEKAAEAARAQTP